MALSDDDILNAIKPQLSDEKILRQIEEPEMSLGESAVRGFSQGATASFGDEINAGVVATRKALVRKLAEKIHGQLPQESQSTFSQDYKTERDKERGMNRKSRGDNPLTHTGAEIVTGMTQSLGGVGAIKEIGKQTLKQALPKLAGVGAAEGAIYGTGASEGEDWSEVIKDAGEGAMWGGAGAVAIPTAFQNVGRAYQKLVRTRGQKVADMVIGDLQKAGYTPEEAARYLEANPDMVVGDLGSNLQWRMADVVTSPGQGAEDLKSLLLNRNLDQLDGRVQPFFQDALGGNPNQGLGKTLQEAQQNLSAQAKPFYDQAAEIPIQLTDEMNAVLNSPGGRQALERASSKAANENVAFGPGSNSRLLHYVGRAFGDMADSVGKHTDEGRQYMSMRGKILDGVKAQNEPFRIAQSIYSDGKGVQDALEQGRKALLGNTLDKVDMINDLPEVEKIAFRSGLFQGLLEKLGSKPDTADVMRIFRQPNVRKVLKAAFDDEAQYEAFVELVKKEGVMSESAQMALYGSRTKPLASFSDDAQAVAETALSAEPINLLARYVMKKGMEARGEAFRNDLAPLLGARADDNLVDLLVKQQERTPYQVTQTLQKLTGS